MTDAEYMRRVTAMERKLYRIAHSILWNDPDCADAIQEAVIKGWQKRASLQEERQRDLESLKVSAQSGRGAAGTGFSAPKALFPLDRLWAQGVPAEPGGGAPPHLQAVQTWTWRGSSPPNCPGRAKSGFSKDRGVCHTVSRATSHLPLRGRVQWGALCRNGYSLKEMQPSFPHTFEEVTFPQHIHPVSHPCW